MGVTGLWPILHPCARPIKLETLNRKRLAVDASIWIYQFLKAVRDKEGNALRNSHVVGFFRRICKLLFFGIKPVFVFDGGAPVLKRQTVLGRKQRREGRREDAVRTAGKLLAVQMQRRGEEENERRKRQKEVSGRVAAHEEEEPLPENLVYVDELGMSNAERQQTRKFTKKDAYHLPDLTNGIEGMGQPNDPRVMSAEELEEYARQFNNGEDVNLYDFSKIDFNGEFFMSLPPGDRYNILNAARLRSRLRMGLSKEQLEEMFPDRMAFSRFQIERVRERNELTQRLMNLNGMNDVDTLSGGGRIAGERGREYVLVKNEGVEGGWALGVVSTDKSVGERNKPIDIDMLHQKIKETQDEESEEDFEDVPVEGLNRLPKLQERTQNLTYDDFQAQDIARQRRNLYASRGGSGPSKRPRLAPEESDSLFVDSDGPHVPLPDHDSENEDLERAIALSLQKDNDPESMERSDEEEHLNRAIALSLQKNHHQESELEVDEFEDVPLPEYEQRAAEAPKPISTSSGRMVAHIVNNRANAAVPKRKAVDSDDSDSDLDLQSALAAARKKKAPAVDKRNQPPPVASNKKNPFDGPLPFEKLDFKSSIFGKKKTAAKPQDVPTQDVTSDVDEEAGGFEKDGGEEVSRPLPPWLVGSDDIRSQVQEQQKRDVELNAEDRQRALEEERIFQRDHGIIEVESSDDGSDVEIVDAPPPKKAALPATLGDVAKVTHAEPLKGDIPEATSPLPQEEKVEVEVVKEASEEDEEIAEWSESDYGDAVTKPKPVTKVIEPNLQDNPTKHGKSPSPEFEDVELPSAATLLHKSPSPIFEDVDMPDTNVTFPSAPSHYTASQVAMDDSFDRQEAEMIDGIDFDEFSDPDDEELLAQLATEAEEHARFASTLNHKSERENQEAYERELKQLRSQQKKDRRDADEVSHIMITECQALLRLFGIPYITAPMEAEAQCAELVNLGLVDGIVTDDSDIFLFGGTRVYKNMFNSNKFVECYLSSDLEKELSLSREQLIAIAHLLGSDYTEGLPGVGPVTAVEIISEFPSAQGLQEFKDWWIATQHSTRPLPEDVGSTFRKKFRRAQATKLFLPPAFPSGAVTEAYLKPDVDSTPEPFQWGVPDLDRLRDFLMATIGWTQERTDEVLVPVIRDMNRRETEGTQSNITRYFEGAVGLGANGIPREKDLGSKRMKDAVSKLRAKKGGRASTPAPLTGTFGDEAAEWARKNDLSFTEREREKSTKARGQGKGKGVRRGKTVVDEEEQEEEEEDEGEAGDIDDDGEDNEEMTDEATGKGKGKARAGRPSTGRSRAKRTKVQGR
ncbi:DNA excision repair protein [Phlyctema vagabunda]|uniref:DNA excision repair protein n=1 Tax=Phlyctema vagabunda TaxID=108571 RepID=A0ABR4P5I7_9HELO